MLKILTADPLSHNINDVMNIPPTGLFATSQAFLLLSCEYADLLSLFEDLDD